MKITIIDPVGGHGGMDYYDYGLAYGLGVNNIEVSYDTCTKTSHRSFTNVNTKDVFGDVWNKTGISKLIAFLYGYVKAFRRANAKESKLFHLQFFSLGFLNLLVLCVAFFFKQKKVVTLHDVESFNGGSSKILAKCCLRLIDAIIVHNKFTKSEFENNFNFQGKLALIPHGNYEPFVNSLPLSIKEERIKILFFGQIKEVKGVDVLLDAMAKVVSKNKNYHLTIAGRPWKTEAKTYESQIIKLGLENYVTTRFEYIQDEDVEQLYRDASIVVMPYKKIYQSGVLLLSLSYGRTVIVSDLKPFTEVISNDQNGFIFESGNSDSLADCILNLNRSKIIETTNKSKELINNRYNWHSIGTETLKLYNSL